MNGQLANPQIDTLMSPIRGARIASRTQGGKQLSYLEAYDVRAHLIRVFGFGGFDAEVLDSELVFIRDYKNNEDKAMQEIAYKATVRLVVRNLDGDEVARFAECAVGSASGGTGFGDLHDNALKTAVSDALKRCAINLGSQFGLGLYDQGSRAEVVRALVVDPRPPQEQELSDEQKAALSNSLGATEVDPPSGDEVSSGGGSHLIENGATMRVEYDENSGEAMPEHEAESRARDIRTRLHQDMHTTAVGEGLTDMPHLIDALVGDAMFQIEHLLVEIEALHIKDRAKSGSLSEPLGWPHD